MLITEPKIELIDAPDYKSMIKRIEIAGRNCYKSETKITDDSAEAFISRIVDRGHEAVLEHSSLTVRFICDRGISHEIVRHRLASYCQESTRYCNYSKEGFGSQITVIKPVNIKEGTKLFTLWKDACDRCETAYFDLLDQGCAPEDARSVLPNSLKTEVIMTANIREWRHFLIQRTSLKAHPDMRYIARMLLKELDNRYPVLFADIPIGGTNNG